jgi:hypothetical protein
MWSEKLIHLGLFQRIPFMIRPGMGDAYQGMMKYPMDMNRGTMLNYNNLTNSTLISSSRKHYIFIVRF